MLKKIERLFARKPSKMLGIDISSSSIKIAEIAWKKNRPTLQNIGIAELPAGLVTDGRIVDVRAVTDILSNVIATSGTSCREAITAVNGQAIFIREMPFPAMAENEMREALKWDMENYVPYPPDSYYYDFAIVGPGMTEQEVKVLIVAAQHDGVQPLVEVIKNAGLRPLAIDIEPMALFRTLNCADNALVVDIGTKVSQIVIFQNASPAVTRTLPIAGQRFTEAIMNALALDFNEAESLKQRQNNLLQRINSNNEYTNVHMQLQLLVDELAREVRRTVEYYQLQNKDAVIDNFYITGGCSNIDNLTHNLTALLDVPVLLYNPLTSIDIPSSFDSGYLKAIAPRLAVAIGLGLRGSDL